MEPVIYDDASEIKKFIKPLNSFFSANRFIGVFSEYFLIKFLFCLFFTPPKHVQLTLILSLAKITERCFVKPTNDDFVIGDNDAPITIIEYASMSCSHCASFHNNTLETLKKEYIDTGKVKFVFRDFPYNYPALLGTMVMRCLPDDIRYDYMNALYRLQKQWVQKENAESTKELFKIMQSGGMNKEEFEA